MNKHYTLDSKPKPKLPLSTTPVEVDEDTSVKAHLFGISFSTHYTLFQPDVECIWMIWNLHLPLILFDRTFVEQNQGPSV